MWPTTVSTRNAPIIGIDQLSAVLPIIHIHRLLRVSPTGKVREYDLLWRVVTLLLHLYQPIVILHIWEGINPIVPLLVVAHHVCIRAKNAGRIA